MKTVSIAAAAASVVLIALTLVPAAGELRGYAATGALLCAVVVLIAVLSAPRDRSAVAVRTPSVLPAAPHAPVIHAQPAPAPPAVAAGDIAAVGLLAALQERGRLVDFLQDDVTAYSDAQVGAAARVVHAGCKTVLAEFFRIVPVRTESEGAAVTLAAGYPSDEYRLVGKLSGQPPFTGTLMHRGWKTESVNLPRVVRTTAERLPPIAPAEVELR